MNGSLKPLRTPLLVLAGGLLLTGLAFAYFKTESDREAQDRLELRSGRYATMVQMCLQDAISMARSIRAVVEKGAPGDGSWLGALSSLGGMGPSAVPGIRWIAFVAPSGPAATPTSISVVAAGAGAPALSAQAIATTPEFAGTILRVLRTGKSALYAPGGEAGVGTAVHLSLIKADQQRGLHKGPLVLALALNSDSLIGDDVAEFLARANKPPIDNYSIKVLISPADEPRAQERLLFEASMSPRTEAPKAPVARGWLEHQIEANLDGTRFRFVTAVARSQLDAPEENMAWWALVSGVALSAWLAFLTGRISNVRRVAEENSRRLGNQVRSSEARFRNLVESTRDWMWETDAAGVFTYSSSNVFQLLGYTSWEIEGRRGADIGFGLDLARAAAGNDRVEFAATHRDGSRIWLLISCTRFSDDHGKPGGYRGVCSDITEARMGADRQRVLEQELNRMDKVGTLDHVMSMVAHELNQPLAAISSYCGASVRMLHDNPASLDEVIASLKAAGGQAQAAAAVVRGIRQLIVRKEPAISSLRVADLIRNARSLAELRLNQARVQLDSRLDPNLPPVLADEILMVQVLLNLLHNAVDAVAEVASPRIRVGVSLGDPGWVRFTIEDNGPGMSNEQLARALEPYVTTKASGLGLGLSISLAIVESHGGNLRLRRNPEGGCIAEFTLRVDRGQLPAAA